MRALSLSQPLYSILQIKAINPLLRNLLLVVIGSFLITLGARISLPLQPVPITLQTLAVLFLGMAYGWRLGFATVLLYLAEGAIGFPVFAEGRAGLPVFFGPTAGYLVGWLPAVIVSGFLVERGWGRNLLGTVLAAVVGTSMILLVGSLFLAQFVGINAAITLGVKPFLLGDVLKIIFLALVIPAFWKKSA